MRGVGKEIICRKIIDKNDNPEMGGQGKYADLHPPMWSGGT
jgi:hypothetical protein